MHANQIASHVGEKIFYKMTQVQRQMYQNKTSMEIHHILTFSTTNVENRVSFIPSTEFLVIELEKNKIVYVVKQQQYPQLLSIASMYLQT
jgi:hypothetical protein